MIGALYTCLLCVQVACKRTYHILFQRVYSLPHDGGNHFGRVLVDLTEQKVIRFSLNAVA